MNVMYFQNLDDLSQAAAAFVEARALKYVTEKNMFALALSGGAAPEKTYALLAASPLRERLPWERIRLFFVDERRVPESSLHSNFRMVAEAMLKFLPIPKKNIFRIPVSRDSVAVTAGQYERKLKTFFSGLKFPVFDLVLLGMGADGHTASLFPGSAALVEKKKWVVAACAPAAFPVQERITLTLPVLNRAREILFIISGKGKGDILREVLSGTAAAADRYPAARIRQTAATTFLVDESIFN
jgi:6-phosphogluconolactonase